MAHGDKSYFHIKIQEFLLPWVSDHLKQCSQGRAATVSPSLTPAEVTLHPCLQSHLSLISRITQRPAGMKFNKQYFIYCQAPTQLASLRPLQVNWTDPEWKWFSRFNFQIIGVAKKVIFLKYILSAKKTFWKWFTGCPTKNYTLFTLLGKIRYNFLWDTL